MGPPLRFDDVIAMAEAARGGGKRMRYTHKTHKSNVSDIVLSIVQSNSSDAMHYNNHMTTGNPQDLRWG
jgi:hypothetical protein